MKIVVTGETGFLESKVVETLKSEKEIDKVYSCSRSNDVDIRLMKSDQI